MSTKRQPSKQRRQTQNQKQRAALEARTPGGGRERRVRRAQRRARGSTASSTPSVRSGSVLSRFRGAQSAGRAARTGGRGTPVGHRAALSALLAAVAAALVGSFLFKVPVDRGGEPITLAGRAGGRVVDQRPGGTRRRARVPPPTRSSAAIDDWLPGGNEPYLQAFWPDVAGRRPARHRHGPGLPGRLASARSAKVVNRTMYVTLFGALLASAAADPLPPGRDQPRRGGLPGAQGRGPGRPRGRRPTA